MKIQNTNLILTCSNDVYTLRSEDGLSVSFTHYNDLSISGRTEKPYFVGYIKVNDKLVSVCEIQGNKASLVYEAVNDYNMR